MDNKRGFASDNNAPVHPKIIEAMLACNKGHTVGYGDDIFTRQAEALIKNHFGEDSEVFFVFNGTAANVLGLNNITSSFNSIICTETAHIEEDECGAPEFITGCKLLPVPTKDGKLSIRSILPHLKGFDFEHHSQPAVVSITQATELGTVYRPDEIRELADYIHSLGMLLHMDGARIANAAAYLGLSLREVSKDCGVDVLSLGATKNGGMYGEAILFFKPELARNMKYHRKQGMQLASKMRYIAAQFSALLTDDLWLQNANHANEMAMHLAQAISNIPGLIITQPVEANGVFVKVKPDWIPELQKQFFFYEWDEKESVVRWMTSWDTTKDDVDSFIELVRSLADRA